MAAPPPVPAGSPSGRFVGLILISIGVLWLTLTGLCTAAALVTLMSEGNLGDVLMIAVFTLPSAVLGAAVYFVGRLLRPRQ
jgi:hypothetical protein